MTVTAQQFRGEFPQFSTVDDGLLEAKLSTAHTVVGTAWGDLRDAGVKYYTAHLLASDPLCEPSAKAPSEFATLFGKTAYFAEFERLQAAARAGFFGSVGSPDQDMTT